MNNFLQLKYNLVVSAYTLFELPSAESRLQILVNLWNKTHEYLVLVEQGTNAGFKVTALIIANVL